jgi:hypothetical protein
LVLRVKELFAELFPSDLELLGFLGMKPPLLRGLTVSREFEEPLLLILVINLLRFFCGDAFGTVALLLSMFG